MNRNDPVEPLSVPPANDPGPADAFEQEVQARIKEGRYPYEGQWRTLDEIKAHQTELKRSDAIVFRELWFLYGVMGAVILLVIVLLFSLLV